MAYFDYGAWDGQEVDRSWTAEVNQFLAESQDLQKDRLRDELDRIDDQLEQRDTLHMEIVADLEWKITRYTDQLKRLYRTNAGNHDGTRDRLKNQIDTFEQRLQDEHRDHWRDRQDLEQERRTILRELAELEKDLSELL